MIYLEIWFFRLVTSVGKRKILRTHEELNDGPSDFALGCYEDHLLILFTIGNARIKIKKFDWTVYNRAKALEVSSHLFFKILYQIFITNHLCFPFTIQDGEIDQYELQEILTKAFASCK